MTQSLRGTNNYNGSIFERLLKAFTPHQLPKLVLNTLNVLKYEALEKLQLCAFSIKPSAVSPFSVSISVFHLLLSFPLRLSRTSEVSTYIPHAHDSQLFRGTRVNTDAWTLSFIFFNTPKSSVHVPET